MPAEKGGVGISALVWLIHRAATPHSCFPLQTPTFQRWVGPADPGAVALVAHVSRGLSRRQKPGLATWAGGMIVLNHKSLRLRPRVSAPVLAQLMLLRDRSPEARCPLSFSQWTLSRGTPTGAASPGNGKHI